MADISRRELLGCGPAQAGDGRWAFPSQDLTLVADFVAFAESR